MTENTNTLRTLMMIFWAIMVALKDDYDGDTMNAIMKAVGSVTGLSVGMGPLASSSGNQEPQNMSIPASWIRPSDAWVRNTHF